jgi:hypothetical protein
MRRRWNSLDWPLVYSSSSIAMIHAVGFRVVCLPSVPFP